MPDTPSIYLAGPEVFLPDAKDAGQRKKRLCEKYGFEGLYPLDNELQANAGSLDREIYRANVALMRQCDLGIINLTPFRGPSADVGTVFELGLLVGFGKPVLSYTNDAADLIERVRRSGHAHLDDATGEWRDAHRMWVEDFGNADNLMLDMALAEGGFPIVRRTVSPERLFTDLGGFEECLRLAAERLNTRR